MNCKKRKKGTGIAIAKFVTNPPLFLEFNLVTHKYSKCYPIIKY